jgi:beta-lactam-binding protein with PASTA domain
VTTIGGGPVDPATGQPDPNVPVVNEGQVVSVKPSAGTVLTLTKTVTLGVAHATC